MPRKVNKLDTVIVASYNETPETQKERDDFLTFGINLETKVSKLKFKSQKWSREYQSINQLYILKISFLFYPPCTPMH